MKQIICIIVAVGKNNRVIGNKGKIPWDLPADLAYFKKKTGKSPIIMGRKTHESIGRILPGRKNIVISSQKDYQPISGALLANSLKEALALAGRRKVFIIGGAQVYKEALPFADRIYATIVNSVFDGDAFFPKAVESEWKETSVKISAPDKENPYWFVWKVYERVKL